MANQSILAAYKVAHDDGDQLVVIGATTIAEFRAAVVAAGLVRMHGHEEGQEHDKPLAALAAMREEDGRFVWDLDADSDTPGVRPAMVANAYWVEADSFDAELPQTLHSHLLHMLGAKDHADAGRIIAGHHARELAAVQQGVQPSAPEVLGWVHKTKNGKLGSKFYTYEPHCDNAVRDDGGEKIAVVSATHPTQQGLEKDMVSVKKEDANNYCRILTTLGMEEDGDPVAEIQRLIAATHPTQQGLDAPTLDDAWKARLLDGAPLARDKYGCGHHHALPNLHEGVRAHKFFEALGIKLICRMAEDEMDSDAYEAMTEHGLTEDGPNYNAWTPAKPEGDGWCLVAVFDTEDGPACWWVRAAQAKQEPTA